MPVIRITSLPLAQDTDVARVLEGLSKEFAESVALNVDSIYVTWEFLSPGHYVHQGRAAGLQENETHPIQVEMISADVFSSTRIELMLHSIAEAISRRTHVPRENIFVYHRSLASGRVFDQGRVQYWAGNDDDGNGPDN